MLLFAFIMLFHVALKSTDAVTLEEGLLNASKYIRYDTTPYNIWIHALISLCITYGTLTGGILIVHLVVYLSGSKRNRRAA
uniref:Uncharacterized protein n=1 Tax=Trichobilharzia regenti TaxID=157069 RepID=A0AA85K987_TRIRE|nr:unnamed protein product [Trichobilharzia regenti]